MWKTLWETSFTVKMVLALMLLSVLVDFASTVLSIGADLAILSVAMWLLSNEFKSKDKS